jgi:hypothetical protein
MADHYEPLSVTVAGSHTGRDLEKFLDILWPDEHTKWRGPEGEGLDDLALDETAEPLIGDAESTRRFGHGNEVGWGHVVAPAQTWHAHAGVPVHSLFEMLDV